MALQSGVADPAALDHAQELFYSARYVEAAAAALAVRDADPTVLAAYELRTSALHFLMRRTIGDVKDKGKAFKACTACADLLADFLTETGQGLMIARGRLQQDPGDDDALFLLSKLHLNYVWLHLSTMGRRTGWGEFREARRSLDVLLARDPHHIRARVARAWIEYIVDTRVPWAVRWMVGGGNRKKGLALVREAAESEGDHYARAEAGFGLWEMQVREGTIPDALLTARALLSDFPDNPDLARFVGTNGSEAGGE